MKRLERTGDPLEAVLAVIAGRQAALWTALPGIVQSFSPTAMTAVVQPAVQGQLQARDGSWRSVNLPLLTDVPVVYPGGGGFTLTFPVSAGDECLVIFASRCIDGWWAYGGVQVQPDVRMHDLSDGFALVGPRSTPRVLAGISAGVQLRADDASVSIEMLAGAVNIIAPAGVYMNGIRVDETHVHGGVETGGGTTGPVT